MELRFDKEIDALLRKARGGGASPLGIEAHIDADSIAAFAEDALPAATRLSYVKHFADCDRCRRILADVAWADTESKAVEAAPVAALLIEVAAPWYSRLFGRSGLAVAFASLLLLFGGVFVVVLVQRTGDTASSTVAKIEEYQQDRNQSTSTSNSVSSAPAAVPSANVSANAAVAGPYSPAANAATAVNGVTASKPMSTPASRTESASDGALRVEDKASEKDRNPESEPPVVMSAPPPPPAGSATTEAEIRSRKDDDEKAKSDADNGRMLKRSQLDSSVTRDAPPSPAKSGPVRSGPMMNQTQQMDKQAGEMSVTRNVGGRSFNYRDGVWYDTGYRSQATANYRRGTDEFSKLDGGLRSVANTLGGTVVVVWKGKAYRIQ